ncbi:4-aminobutyrate aminotransferase-like enzyme/Ser/Thr protein kinase RdoA (MazF antagonist) [Rhizobium aethiopicum]|uniref:4-aminobutyrate aminotransferase-like enzyme/Ser/Thr protein kinase RdoA (MazF antagonist) n=1 Tax=Rhizobium aethiopicum TaxID=1138170 RepID=A0A7W6VQD4_9HYPH|nr:aminotransferase [Rhizobium aethiopicum]MBB4194039.1 4-aminobutyrate aminotransferase-like enzyme/Ser/Thr protein kinase RdoA (MazF antagonist) [Rhizobium aethiopicum]MBB4581240.1 4-aminobutyrate aminotransferase-like enzyme/Ser/Thr protein kinase RdoA (MazF antagonist) [Rhizobium aethiopicum]
MTDEALVDRMTLPRPDVTVADAEEILLGHYSLSGTLTELGSQQDRNYRVDSDRGRYVLKFCHAAYETRELEAQNAALHHLKSRQDAPRVPKVIATNDGREIVALTVRGRGYQVRLLEFLEGQGLTEMRYLAPASVAAIGALCARLAQALADFDHPGLDRSLQWDLRRAGPVAVQLLSAITDSAARDRIAKTMVMAVRRIQPLAPSLRLQAVHHDVTGDNVVGHRDAHGHTIPDGVIDFGDIIRGWLVGDLAVTCASLLHQANGDPFHILPAVTAYQAIYPLIDEELKALWPLIVARAVILVASSEQQMSIDPDNDYVRSNLDRERAIFDTVMSVPFELMEAAILKAAGADVAAPSASAWLPLLPDIDPAAIAYVDLGVRSAYFSAGNWLDADMDWRLLARAATENGTAATRYGEYRLSRAALGNARAQATFALHVDICLAAGSAVAAPFAGRIGWKDQHLTLTDDSMTLHLDGLDPLVEDGAVLAAGDPLGSVFGEASSLGGLRLQLCSVASLEPPLFATPREAAAWSVLCPSPSPLLSLGADAPQPETAELLVRRQAHFASAQKNYYAAPPQIERGWREYLFDVEGRAYLDMVNNVTILGHGHPRMAAAISAQWLRLNTNSRFHYAAIAEFSERLAALAPDGLDAVFLVNSGSEANDLAIRLAQAHSGARNMLCLLEAYHGWSAASDAVSTSIADNPLALTTRPDWVHAAVSPNTYRGAFRGPDTAARYLATVMPVLETIDAGGQGLAGFICESVYGNAGGIPLPEGYLKEIYTEVRARGGLCIADEVQVGYGRLGHYFWGFEQQGVVPDIITVAKGMGNGHPLGAVITRREIAQSLEKQGPFFSSTGGSPVSCVAGITVLDIMADEKLRDNARTVGDHLKARLAALIDRHPIAGAVHGMGLYLGLEFVRDRTTLEPATEETAAICDRLLELGIIMQPTGDHQNVLKIKPPLCLSIESADFFADMLEKVLQEGW